MPAMLTWPWQSIGGGCQSSEMAALVNSLSFAFTSTVSDIFNYIVSGAVGYNVIGAYRWILPKL